MGSCDLSSSIQHVFNVDAFFAFIWFSGNGKRSEMFLSHSIILGYWTQHQIYHNGSLGVVLGPKIHQPWCFFPCPLWFHPPGSAWRSTNFALLGNLPGTSPTGGQPSCWGWQDVGLPTGWSVELKWFYMFFLVFSELFCWEIGSLFSKCSSNKLYLYSQYLV